MVKIVREEVTTAMLEADPRGAIAHDAMLTLDALLKRHTEVSFGLFILDGQPIRDAENFLVSNLDDPSKAQLIAFLDDAITGLQNFREGIDRDPKAFKR